MDIFGQIQWELIKLIKKIWEFLPWCRIRFWKYCILDKTIFRGTLKMVFLKTLHNLNFFLLNNNHFSNRTLYVQIYILWLKGPISGLRHFFASESPLKMMKNAFYFSP